MLVTFDWSSYVGPWWWCDGVNMATFMPAVDKILERYILKFSKGSKAKLHEDDLGLVSGEPEEHGEAYYYVVCAGCPWPTGGELK